MQHTKTDLPQGVVSGRITLEGSDRGIPNLVVEALEVSGEQVKRRGSTSTDSAGNFRIELHTPRDHADQRWNLQLVVLAPERANSARTDRELFRSAVREQAEHREHFRIELAPEMLKSIGIELRPPRNVITEAAIAAISSTQAHAEKVQAAADKVFTTRIESVEARRTFFRDDVRKLLADELSTVSEVERGSDQFVANDDEIKPKHLAALKSGLEALMATKTDPLTGAPVREIRMKVRLQLSADQRQILSANSSQPDVLTEAEIEKRLGISLDKPPAIYQRHLEPDPCRPKTGAEKCLDDIPHDDSDPEDDTDDPGGDSGTPPSGDVGGANVTFDRGVALARIMSRQSAPEDSVVFGSAGAGANGGHFESSLKAEEVSRAINQIVFTPGPADVPSFYDFHDLQIAFQPVWQEALDDKYLHDVEAAYDQIVEQGGAPAVNKITSVVNAHRLSGKLNGLFDKVFDNLHDFVTVADVEVPATVVSAVMISLDEWRALPAASRSHLIVLADRIAGLREELIAALDPDKIPDTNILNLGELIRAANTAASIAIRSQIQLLQADAQRIVAHARRLVIEREANQPFKPTHAIIDQLRHRRREAYPFRYFAASSQTRSVNFGVLLTYRQKWMPVSYQVGELVSTIPLAPMEVRKFSRRTVIKTTRAQKEIESNLISRRSESQETSRAEAEIVARATAKTAFSRANAETVNMGENAVGGSTTTTTTFTRDADKHSESVKRQFREAILKTAEEYKNERKIEVSTEESFEQETAESGEIRNPNDEIPVTFLFYELQRRFKVSEKLHRLQSVVLVAQEVPAPSAIDTAWLIRHDWIINRVLLDDSFHPALTYASTSLISEDVALKEMRDALFRQRTLVEELKEDVADRRALVGLRYAALQKQLERTAKAADSGGGLFGGLGDLIGSVPIAGDIVQGGLDLLTGGGSAPFEAAQIREGASRDAFDREMREAEEVATRLTNALSTLEVMQRAYTERLANHLRELAQVERLLAHIVQNIMHYMQAIWSYEPDHQRYMRLRNVPVPVFEKDKTARRYAINPTPMRAFSNLPNPGLRDYVASTDLGVFQPDTPEPEFKTRPLSEVARINHPLGCFANYMIFPMIEANPITEFMMDPYVTLAAGEYGVSDPDPLGNMTLEEFSDYVCCLKRHFDRLQEAGEGGATSEVNPFDELKPQLRDTLKRLLQLSLRNDDEVIVPSGNLYIEALPGAHSIIEQFKHLHRQIDVKLAQSRLREMEIDNIRQAQRIVANQLEDPDVEAKYVFEGDAKATVVPPPGPSG